MGADNSTELPRAFQEVSKWPKPRVDSAVKAFNEGEYDFGVDYTVVMNITGYEMEEAKELITAHAKNESGVINAITLLVSLISVGNCDNRDEVGRLEAIFDLMDFSRNGQISQDELTILLLCVGSSYSFILAKQHESTVDPAIIKFSKQIYDSLKKRSNSNITKAEFVDWVKENVFSQGMLNINDILNTLVNGIESHDAKSPEKK